MSATFETSHSPIDPRGLLEQSPSGDSLRHVPTALLSCTLDCGTNAGLRVGAEQWDCVASKHWGKLNEARRCDGSDGKASYETEVKRAIKVVCLRTHQYKNVARC